MLITLTLLPQTLESKEIGNFQKTIWHPPERTASRYQMGLGFAFSGLLEKQEMPESIQRVNCALNFTQMWL
jgi:hypothetical protein